jgi:hypothetical protein
MKNQTLEAVLALLRRCRMNACTFSWPGYIEDLDGIFKTTVQPGGGDKYSIVTRTKSRTFALSN